MKILLTNDDGIEGEGLCTLASALRQAGHEILIVAPTENNSAVSHKISLRSPVPIERREVGYAVGGTPADCVLIALFHLGFAPDLLLSGINAGLNLGSDVLYSGTVGAASEGAQNGIPSIALSQYLRRSDPSEGPLPKYMRAAALTVEHLGEWALLARETDLLNINFPALPPRGIRFCGLDKTVYYTRYTETAEGLRYDLSAPAEHGTESDAALLTQGYATITPMRLDRTDRAFLRRRGSEV